jgi:choloylglycine hydrolase
MKTRAIVTALALICAPKLQACSTFCFKDNNEQRIVGKVFDWSDSHALVTVNKRNVSKRAFVLKSLSGGARWVSKFGSVTFNQYGRDFPMGGMNEKGLTVEIMVGTAKHPSMFDRRPVVNELQWIQYVLDNYATVADMLNSIDGIRVEKVMQEVHYMVCDLQAECSTVEYLDGRLVTHSGQTLLSKNFSNAQYESSVSELKTYEGFGGQQPLPPDISSLSRFTRTAVGLKNYAHQESESYAFDLLKSVALSGEWRIVYSGENKIKFQTAHDARIREVDLSRLDFDCARPVKVLDIDQSIEGPVDNYWQDYSTDLNRELVNKNKQLPSVLRSSIVSYPENYTRCLN